MPTTHIFAIGGTGARIVKSLTFLLASGYPVQGDRKIKPIFLDPDKRNGDGTRTHRALTLYNRIHEATQGQTTFFGTPVERPFGNEQEGWGASLGAETGGNYFQDRIDYHGLSDDMQDFTRLLFGTKLLETTLENGYLGNPNLGTVALNSIKSEGWFKTFAENYQADDEIILVASIFGGTGAAGLPLLIKTLRNAGRYGLTNQDLLEKARIGAIIVQPYFGVSTDSGSPINQNTFVVKTKAALAHYRKDIDAEIQVNYPVGDPIMKPFPNSKGGGKQKNPAHFAEVVGALNIIDFMNGRKDRFVPFGTKDYPMDFTFTSIGRKTRDLLQRNLTQYTYAVKYWNERMSHAVGKGTAWTKRMATGGSPLDSSFVSSDKFFADDLLEFNQLYLNWLAELRSQQRSFYPLKYETDGSNLHELVRGVEQNKMGLWRKRSWDYDDFDEALNAEEKGMSTGETPQRLLDLFHQTTSSIYDARVPN